MQAARCRLFARGATRGPGFIDASGLPRFVGTAVGSYYASAAVGMAIQQWQNFDDCMQVNGRTIVNELSAGKACGSRGLARGRIQLWRNDIRRRSGCRFRQACCRVDPDSVPTSIRLTCVSFGCTARRRGCAQPDRLADR